MPNSVLSTDAGVVRVTAPGRKECEGVGDSPGDGLPLTAVHPSYTLTNLRPSGFQPKVTGMDWLPDGRLVISTWGGTDQSGTSQAARSTSSATPAATPARHRSRPSGSAATSRSRWV